MESPPTPRIDWMTRRDAANYAGVSINTLDRWLDDGRVPRHKVGRTVRINRAELDAAIMAPAGGDAQ